MSCAMICGEPNIWPMPTGRTKVSSRSLTLSADAVTVQVETPHAAVEQLLHSAFDLFVGDLQLLETNTAGGTPDRSDRKSDAARASAAAAAGGQAARNRPECDKESADSELAEQQQQLLRTRRYCDIKHLNVKILVNGMPDVYLNLDTDESYNLTVTSELTLATHDSFDCTILTMFPTIP